MSHEKTAAVVNALFERLIAINPAYKQSWPNEQSLAATKREWVFAFIDAEITTTEQLKKGLSKCRLAPSPFIPSPGQFIEWCKVEPEDIGAPSIRFAYDEACTNSRAYETKKNWSHPTVKHAAVAVGSMRLSQESKDKTYPLFEKEYLEACNLYSKGNLRQQLPAPDVETRQKGAYTLGKYEFVRPGVLKQYEVISSREEAMAVIEKLLGKGDSRLKDLVRVLEHRYNQANND